MTLRERIGVDFGGKMRLEDALEWAAANEVFYADVCVDNPPNAIETFDETRLRDVRSTCAPTWTWRCASARAGS